MHLIWTNVVLDRASEDERYSRLAKNQKLDVQFNIDEIIEVLRTSFSFMSLNTENSDRQPQIPKQPGLRRHAINLLNGMKRNGEMTKELLSFFIVIKSILTY